MVPPKESRIDGLTFVNITDPQQIGGAGLRRKVKSRAALDGHRRRKKQLQRQEINESSSSRQHGKLAGVQEASPIPVVQPGRVLIARQHRLLPPPDPEQDTRDTLINGPITKQDSGDLTPITTFEDASSIGQSSYPTALHHHQKEERNTSSTDITELPTPVPSPSALVIRSSKSFNAWPVPSQPWFGWVLQFCTLLCSSTQLLLSSAQHPPSPPNTPYTLLSCTSNLANL